MKLLIYIFADLLIDTSVTLNFKKSYFFVIIFQDEIKKYDKLY